MTPTLSERLMGYGTPGALIAVSAAYYLKTAITSPKLMLTDFYSFRNLAFAKFWRLIAPEFATQVPPGLDQLVAESRGLVMDVGPGSGDQVFRFTHPENIKTIYGVEPGIDLHHDLQEATKKAGLGEKYKILSCGVEAESLMPILAKEDSLLKEGKGSFSGGVFDYIVCIRVLCGVPRPNETIENLYKLLKPGGRLVVCEHVVNGESTVGRLLQGFYMLLAWPFWVGGCQLTRDTATILTEAAHDDGGWSEMKLETVDGWSVIPHIIGYCVKK